MQQFASDNYAGICPEALDSLLKANGSGDEVSYGDDPWTARACEAFRNLFETDCEVYFVFNGTAANSLALAHLCRSYQAIICHEIAHVEIDECGAPGFFSGGAKLLPVQGSGAKLTAESVEAAALLRTDLHAPRARAVTLTQATELGTVYTPAEIQAISAVAKTHDLRMHMDGARFANAAASLNVHPAEITWRAGVDVLSFGGTKNGLPMGEAVIFFDKALAADFDYRGEAGRPARLQDALFLGPVGWLLENDVWLRNARHANAMATSLYDGLVSIPQVKVMHPPEANAVFAEIPAHAAAALREQGWKFYDFIGANARFMCSWETRGETITDFWRNCAHSAYDTSIWIYAAQSLVRFFAALRMTAKKMGGEMCGLKPAPTKNQYRDPSTARFALHSG